MNTEILAQQSFEELMTKLKHLLELLEKGEQSLEESMSSYEEGVTIVRMAEEKLKKMEGRMEQIMADGTVSDFSLSGDAHEQA